MRLKEHLVLITRLKKLKLRYKNLLSYGVMAARDPLKVLVQVQILVGQLLMPIGVMIAQKFLKFLEWVKILYRQPFLMGESFSGLDAILINWM